MKVWFISLTKVIQIKKWDLKNTLKARQCGLLVHKQQNIPLEPYQKMSHLVRRWKKLEKCSSEFPVVLNFLSFELTQKDGARFVFEKNDFF